MRVSDAVSRPPASDASSGAGGAGFGGAAFSSPLLLRDQKKWKTVFASLRECGRDGRRTSCYYPVVHRNPDSHKGENGKVAIIGGSRDMHGAPLFSALAAEATGVDLLFVCVPAIHEEVTKAQSLNFQVRSFAKDDLSAKDVNPILELLATMDSAVIGPGIERTDDCIEAIGKIVSAATCPLVLDASALQPQTLSWTAGKPCVLTPHRGELERMKIQAHQLREVCDRHAVTIHFKGQTDRIFTPDGKEEAVEGGNAGLTVGGTGDALAGVIAGLLAQGLPPGEACRTASSILKQTGDALFQQQGYSYTTRDVIEMIPHVLHSLTEE